MLSSEISLDDVLLDRVHMDALFLQPSYAALQPLFISLQLRHKPPNPLGEVRPTDVEDEIELLTHLPQQWFVQELSGKSEMYSSSRQSCLRAGNRRCIVPKIFRPHKPRQTPVGSAC